MTMGSSGGLEKAGLENANGPAFAALGCGHDADRDALVGIQRLDAGMAQAIAIDENVLVAVIGGNEAVAAFGAPPLPRAFDLDRAGQHGWIDMPAATAAVMLR